MSRSHNYYPDYRAKGGRAIAWFALFFSLLACTFSGLALLATWNDGQLMLDLIGSSQRIQDNWRKKKADQTKRTSKAERNGKSENAMKGERTEQANGESEADHPDAIPSNKIQDRLKRLEAMVRSGDVRAKYHLENFKDDLERWRERVAERSPTWLNQAIQSLGTVRDKLVEDAPEAARRLKSLAVELKGKVKQLPSMSDLPPIPTDARSTSQADR